ncbi:MAG: D-inositol-3-phosphate glycosyltransferase [Corynebacterium sp.]|nr:D-inositol-3-phosphate glycosyltransferase [Corynebacterium sp.]
MRVAMISLHTSTLAQPGSGDSGGLNVYVDNTARRLAAMGMRIDVFTRATSPGPTVIDVTDTYRVINITAGPYDGVPKEELYTQLTTFADGIRAWAREPYDLIHSHYWLSGEVASLLSEVWQIPFVHTAHTLAAVKNLAKPPDDTPESQARRTSEQHIVNNAAVLIANTELERADLIAHYNADPAKIRVVYPGVDLAVFTPGPKQEHREKVIAFVGRLQQFKGPHVVLEAAAHIRHNHPDLPLAVLLCGGASGAEATGETYHTLARELGLEGTVRFLDPVPARQLVDIYRAADVVAVPSYNESFGLVAVEAQASGTPVVAARVGGLPIAVSGVLVDTHDPAVWAREIYALLADEERRLAMAQQAVTHARRFSWAATAEGLAESYEFAQNMAH